MHQILRAAVARKTSSTATESYDLIYCAGLFDYLADTTCKALVKMFESWLRPGGLVTVANMHDANRFGTSSSSSWTGISSTATRAPCGQIGRASCRERV